MAEFVCAARIKREQPVEGMRPIVTLTLIHDDDAVELTDGDEFATVTLKFDPWDDSTGIT